MGGQGRLQLPAAVLSTLANQKLQIGVTHRPLLPRNCWSLCHLPADITQWLPGKAAQRGCRFPAAQPTGFEQKLFIFPQHQPTTQFAQISFPRQLLLRPLSLALKSSSNPNLETVFQFSAQYSQPSPLSRLPALVTGWRLRCAAREVSDRLPRHTTI